MFIVGPECENVKVYLTLYWKDSPDPGRCPLCGRRLRKHAHYGRWVIGASGLVSIPLYRAYCPDCRKTGVLYPAFLKPYARYESILREKVLGAHFEGQPWSQAARETFSSSGEMPQHRALRRWARDLEEKAPRANEILAAWLAKWEPHFDQRSLWPGRVGERLPAQLLFRYGSWFLNLLARLKSDVGTGGLFVFLRRQSETAGILL